MTPELEIVEEGERRTRPVGPSGVACLKRIATPLRREPNVVPSMSLTPSLASDSC